MANGSQTEFIEASKVLIENALFLPEISSVLALYGYDSARMREGARLWSQADTLVRKQVKEYGEQQQAGADIQKARDEVETIYMKALKVARVVFSEDILAGDALKLYGPRRQSMRGWMDQVSTFYANLGADPELAQKMLRFGYTDQKLLGEADLVEDLRQRLRSQIRETGEAQSLASERDKKLHELDTWVSELRAIARIAFYESPRELETLGLSPPGGRRRSKDAALSEAKK